MAMNRRTFLALTVGAGAGALGRAAGTDAAARVGVIGSTGHGDYGHGLDTVWSGVPGTRIVAVADDHPAGLAKARQRLQVERGFSDYREMLSTARPELVVVCPRHIDRHAEMILAAIEAGARGVYVEKPFCRTPDEADRIVAAAARTGTKIAVAHRNRYHPALPAVREALARGTIGRLLEIRSRGKEDRRGGVEDLWVLGSHVLNLMHYFGGAPVACTAQLYQDNRVAADADKAEGAEGIGPVMGDALHARFELASGVPAFFDSIRDAEKASENYGLQLVGTRGVINVRIDKHPIAHLIEGPPGQPPVQARAWVPISSAGIGAPEPDSAVGDAVSSHRLAAQDLLAAVRDNRPPLCSADDGRVVIEMIGAVLASHRNNGARIDWPLRERGNPLRL